MMGWSSRLKSENESSKFCSKRWHCPRVGHTQEWRAIPGLGLEKVRAPSSRDSAQTIFSGMNFPRRRVMTAWGKHFHGISVILLELYRLCPKT